MDEPIYQLHTLLWDSRDRDWEWSHDGTFATPELAQEYVPTQLAEGTYRWRLVSCWGRRRWIAVVPRSDRYHDGWASAYIIDEDHVIHAVAAAI